MEKLPVRFLERMKMQLPQDEWEAFLRVYEQKAWKGIRLNPLKGERQTLLEKLSFAASPVPWEENGFYTTEDKVGSSPFHAAGVFYSQEPSAMSAAPLLDVQPRERVLDLCSAPGGKGTQLACKMQGEGCIVLNEPVSSRAKILSQNVERMGIENAVVISALPETLSARFAGYFDKILIDAPCSGEGMFRKNAEEALAEWSEENVETCAKRQAHILEEGTKMLRKGGRLVYSTCTFSEAEDEGQVRDYLQKHTEMRLLSMEKLYPHKVDGEGHFVALMEKTGDTPSVAVKAQKTTISKQAETGYRAFEKSFMTRKMQNLYEAGGCLYALPNGVFDFSGLQVLRVGVRLGEWKNGRFEPSHSLAMCLKQEECRNVLDLSKIDRRVEKYLHGETVDVEERERVQNGWCLVCIEGYPLGLGKVVNGVVKNHYPKGLRKHG